MAEHVISDENWNPDLAQPGDGMCGCLPRRSVYGALPFAQPAKVDLIPYEEWPDRIADEERNQSSLWHVWQDSKIGVLMQGQLNYCWGFSGVTALMLERELQGLPYVPLSPSSVVAPIVGYMNRGGYIEDCLKGMMDQGASSTDYVPQATNRAQEFKPGWREDAHQYRVTMWADVPADHQTQGTMLFLKRPVPVGLNFWGHSVLFLRVLDRYPKLKANNPNRYGTKYLNSWDKTWGDGGCGILEGSKQVADQAYAIEQSNFTE